MAPSQTQIKISRQFLGGKDSGFFRQQNLLVDWFQLSDKWVGALYFYEHKIQVITILKYFLLWISSDIFYKIYVLVLIIYNISNKYLGTVNGF